MPSIFNNHYFVDISWMSETFRNIVFIICPIIITVAVLIFVIGFVVHLYNKDKRKNEYIALVEHFLQYEKGKKDKERKHSQQNEDESETYEKKIYKELNSDEYKQVDELLERIERTVQD